MRRPYAARRPNKHLAPQSLLTYEVRFAPLSGQSILLDAPLAFKAYDEEVKAGTFPSEEHTFKIDEEALEKLY